MTEGFIAPHGGYRDLLSYQETEIKLTNVARASLEELLADFLDFLRTRGLKLWDKNSREALFVRKLSQGSAGKPQESNRRTSSRKVVCASA